MGQYSQVLDDKQLSRFMEECDEWQVSSHTGSPSDKQIADEQFTQLAAYAIPELVQEVKDLRSENEGYKEWGQDVKRLTRELDVELFGAEAAPQASLCDLIGPAKKVADKLRFTEASTEQALAILDEALKLDGSRYDELPMLIERAIANLRPAAEDVCPACKGQQRLGFGLMAKVCGNCLKGGQQL